MVNITNKQKTLRGSDTKGKGQYSNAPDLKSNDSFPFGLLEAVGGSPGSLQVLIFWSKHPSTRFTLASLSYALDARSLQMKQTMANLMRHGIVDETTENQVKLYALTANEERRRQVEDLSQFSWDEIQLRKDLKVAASTQS